MSSRATTEAPNPTQTSVLEQIASPDLTMCFVILIWGVNFAVVKTALMQIGPLPFTAMRFILASALLALLLRWREGNCAFPRGAIGKYFLIGFIGNTAYSALFSIGLSRTTSANASLILATTPVMVALTGGLMRIEKITRHTLVGISLAFAGIVIVMTVRGASVSSRTVGGDLFVLGSVFCWTAYVLGMRRIGPGVSSLRSTALTMMAGTPGLVIIGLPGMLRTDWSRVRLSALIALVYSSVMALVLCYLLYNRSVRMVGGVRTTIYGCAIPVVAAIVAWPMLGERPSPVQGAGAALIIAGVLLSRRM